MKRPKRLQRDSSGLILRDEARMAPCAARRRRGVVLILVLVVIAVLSLAALTFSELMLTERKAALLSSQQVQARALAESGVEMARVFLAWDEQTQYELGGWYDNPAEFQGVLVLDDSLPKGCGRFTFVASQVQEGASSGIRYGLENESARLNLNTLLEAEKLAQSAGVENGGRQLLMGLPGMTDYIADAVLDFLDPDDDPREFGAENEYYSTLEPPYSAKNGYLDSIEELLLVRGITPSLLFGVDANRNGSADSSEPDPASLLEVDNSDGSMNRGWAAYLTTSSLEANVGPDGQPKINLNQSDMETLYTELEAAVGSDAAEFIVAYRQFGPYSPQEETGSGEFQPQDGQSGGSGKDGGQGQNAGSGGGGGGGAGGGGAGGGSTGGGGAGGGGAGGGGAGGGGAGGGGAGGGGTGGGGGGSSGSSSQTGDSKDAEGEQDQEEKKLTPNGLDLSQPGKVNIQSVLDLIGAQVQINKDDKPWEPAFPDDSDSMREYLPPLMSSVTTDTRSVIPGRINVNQAPGAVLAGIPGMTSELVEEILYWRQPDPGSVDSDRRHPTWLLAEGLVLMEDMKKMMPFLTGGGSVFRVQAIGYFDQGGATARIEVVLDATKRPARVIFWRDLSHLERGYPLEILGTDTPEM